MPFKSNGALMNPDDVVLCLIDHQSGLLQLVEDLKRADLRANIIALARLAKLTGIPVIVTASVPDGFNGPVIPEIGELLPNAVYVPRHGQINAWDNELFVDAVKKIGKKTLVMSGTLSNVCLAFPAISAAREGYKVYALMDASGCWSEFSKDLVLARLVQAGVIPTDVMALISEIQQTWARPEAQEFAKLFSYRMPAYKLLMETFARSQQVAKSGELEPDKTTTMKDLAKGNN